MKKVAEVEYQFVKGRTAGRCKLELDSIKVMQNANLTSVKVSKEWMVKYNDIESISDTRDSKFRL